ncbi:DUF4902 domain-containing protein [Variovorax paradoxus]|uniref:DUF4902 domain-containing protein n=1 Tax=Variovorax paradoxus TaxID=34073 RepID=UPI002783CC42|nr:DUF4902 domain-containing protein [Variovorax paradoxus]MDP9927825.1 hypothetical protein [Variovorax paradoxus]
MNHSFNDGLLRLRLQGLRNVELLHLISGIDDDLADPGVSRCGASTTLSGYTEWISPQEARLTLGWDWQLKVSTAASRIVRLGLPRTNVLIVRSVRDPLPWEQSLGVLASFIDAFDWSAPAFNAVCERYERWPAQEVATAMQQLVTAPFAAPRLLSARSRRSLDPASAD